MIKSDVLSASHLQLSLDLLTKRIFLQIHRQTFVADTAAVAGAVYYYFT